jgi:hypothetical protein
MCMVAQCKITKVPEAIAITLKDLQTKLYMKMANWAKTCSVLNICNKEKSKHQQ